MIRLPLTDFSGGLLSGKIAGRYDMEVYLKGCAELENWEPLPQGGVSYRPGSSYLTTTKGSAKARLFPFIASPTTLFLIEAGHTAGTGYLRIHQEIVGTLTLIAEFVNGVDLAVIPWSTDTIIADIHTATEASKIYFAERNFAPRVLTWNGGTSFTFGLLAITGNTGTAWAGTTAYVKNDIVSNGSTPTRLYKCTTAGTSASSGGPTTTSFDITDGTVTWAYIGEMAPFQSSGNYPAAIGAINGRIVFAGSNNEPQAVWASKPFEPGNFTYFELIEATYKQVLDRDEWVDPYEPETEEVTVIRDATMPANAFKIEILSNENEHILGLATARDLIILSTTGETTIPGNVNATSAAARLQSRHSGTRIQPKTLGGLTYFVSSKKKIMAAMYSAQSETYEASETTILSEACAAGIVNWDYAQNPVKSLYVVLADGTMAVMTTNPLSGISSWWKYSVGPSGLTDAIESVAIIPGADGDDDVYLIVKRGAARHIVKLDRPWLKKHLDDAVDGTAAAGVVTGLSHLNGMTVEAVKGGIEYSAVVTAGSATFTGLPNGACRVGLPYTATLRTMRLPVPSEEGAIIGQARRVNRINVSMYLTEHFKTGPDLVTLTPCSALVPGTPETQERILDFAGTNGTDAWVYLYQDRPLPATILAIAPEVE